MSMGMWRTILFATARPMPWASAMVHARQMPTRMEYAMMWTIALVTSMPVEPATVPAFPPGIAIATETNTMRSMCAEGPARRMQMAMGFATTMETTGAMGLWMNVECATVQEYPRVIVIAKETRKTYSAIAGATAFKI